MTSALPHVDKSRVIALHGSALDRLMPMHLWVGTAGQVIGAGQTAAKMLGGDIVGRDLFDLIAIKRPTSVTTISALLALVQTRLKVLLQAHPDLSFTALAVALPAGSGVLLNLSPRANLIPILARFELTLADFAPTDLLSVTRRSKDPGRILFLGIAIAFSASSINTITGFGDVYFDSIAMFTFFLLSARFFEMGSRKQTSEATEALLNLKPAIATRLIDYQNKQSSAIENQQSISVTELNVGDYLLVRPGEIIATDGTIVHGVSGTLYPVKSVHPSRFQINHCHEPFITSRYVVPDPGSVSPVSHPRDA